MHNSDTWRLFEHPELLWALLILVPALTAFFWWAWKAKQRLISQFVQSRLLANLTVGVSAKRQKWRIALLVFAAALLVVVLARPQWGFTWEEAKQRGLDVVIALDTSRSMLAPDVAPNRLSRAKLAALDLKKLAKTDRVGLVAFAGTAFIQCPLSFDDDAFRQSLQALDATIIPQGGTALAEAIHAAESAFKDKNENHKILVIFSDGEDHDGNALEAARAAAKNGLRIFTVGVGTGNGELLRVTDSQGRSDYIRDSDGNVVKSRLNEQLLRDISQAGQGFYMLLAGANTIDLLYERGLAPLPKDELSSRRFKRYHERYQWFLGLVIIILLVEMFLPERKRVQRSEAMVTASNPDLRKALSILICILLPLSAWAAPSPSSAKKKFDSGRYDSALYDYQKLLSKKPKDARLHFNAASAAYRARDYKEAEEQLNSALITDDVQLQQKTYYNLGNTQFRRGEELDDLTKRQQAWEQALSSYQSAARLDEKDADAQYNIDLVKKKIEELKQQQQQQKQQNQDKQDEDKNQDNKDQQDQQKDEQKKDEQQKQNEGQQDQQQKEQQEKQQQQPDSKKDEQKQSQPQQKPDQKQEGQKPEDQQSAGKPSKVFQMTPQEAERILDAIKNEEKAMIFIPQNKTNRVDRVFKDW